MNDLTEICLGHIGTILLVNLYVWDAADMNSYSLGRF